jgi:hypothetical protein
MEKNSNHYISYLSVWVVFDSAFEVLYITQNTDFLVKSSKDS